MLNRSVEVMGALLQIVVGNYWVFKYVGRVRPYEPRGNLVETASNRNFAVLYQQLKSNFFIILPIVAWKWIYSLKKPLPHTMINIDTNIVRNTYKTLLVTNTELGFKDKPEGI